MISRAHRFHGYRSLRHAYSQGQTARGPLFSVKAAPNPRRKTYRVAVVVSRKVHKSAVARNRIRRRLYAAVRLCEKDISGPFDIILTVFSSDLLDLPPKSLERQLKRQLAASGALTAVPRV